MTSSSSKARAAGVSASSFLDLQAELSKKGEEFKKARAAGKGSAVVASERKTDKSKKPTQWSRPNKGVATRAAKDLREFEALSNQTVETARVMLEKKSAMYEKLKKGQTGGLNSKQYDALLVDFDRKMEEEDHYSSDEDDVDESLAVPSRSGRDDHGDDPVVEYQDEFGRTRTARQSEVPRHLSKPPPPDDWDDTEAYVIHNPQNHFPTYEPSIERINEIQNALENDLKNPIQHYDGTLDNREKGAGFYQFSADEEIRSKEMEELMKAREQTMKVRGEDAETGSDTPVVPPESTGKPLTAGEKRKRELEERRRALDAKRKKVTLERATAVPEPEPVPRHQTGSVDPMANLEKSVSRPDVAFGGKQITAQKLAEDFLSTLESELKTPKQR